jgi:hypothetical protein
LAVREARRRDFERIGRAAVPASEPEARPSMTSVETK